MKRLSLTFLKDDAGATSSEYAIMAACIAGVIAATVGLFGNAVSALFQTAVGVFSGS